MTRPNQAPVGVLNVNDSHSSPEEAIEATPGCGGIADGVEKVKTTFHLLDDTFFAIQQALNISSQLFMKLVKIAVGLVFLIVSALEFQETRKELKELKQKLAELNDDTTEIAEIRKKHLRRQIKIAEFNRFLCIGALLLSGLLISLTAVSVVITGMIYFPAAIMSAILIKQIFEHGSLQDKFNEQMEIIAHSQDQKEIAVAQQRAEEIKSELFYKKSEIFSQVLITLSFIAGAVALGILSFGAVPLALMITGALIGTLFKIHQIYKKNQTEQEAVRTQLETENHELRERLAGEISNKNNEVNALTVALSNEKEEKENALKESQEQQKKIHNKPINHSPKLFSLRRIQSEPALIPSMRVPSRNTITLD